MSELASSTLVRWLSLRAYGLVTSMLFGAATSPLKMRARFERFSRTPRKSIKRRFPNVVFEDHSVDGLAIESVRAVASPAREAIMHLEWHSSVRKFENLATASSEGDRVVRSFEALSVQG